MYLIRPVALTDLDQMIHLAERAGPGLSLPKDHQQMRLLVQESVISFGKEVLYPGAETYLFVCEKMGSGKIVGCSAIHAKTGGFIPLYMYKVVDVVRTSPITGERTVITRLHPHKIHDGPTEICMLYILSKYRKEGLGSLLSLSRFLFLNQFRDRFERQIIALMRPHIAPSGAAPFWDAISKPFFQMDFPTVCHFRYTHSRDVELLLPKYPIYASLLPPAVEESIRRVHPKTEPALDMLRGEGFELTDMIDAIDGGPMVEANAHQIGAIQRQREVELAQITKEAPKSNLSIVSNRSMAFRACYTSVRKTKKGAVLGEQAAEALGLEEGDSFLYLPSRKR